MRRAYDVRTVAVATTTSAKWIDNVLSHYSLPGVLGGRQGVARQVSDLGILAIELTRLLVNNADMAMARAVALVDRVLAARDGNVVSLELASGISIQLDLGAIERELRQRIVDAMESVAPVRRGRPRRSPSR